MSLVRFAHSGHSFMTPRNSREIFYEHGHNILLCHGFLRDIKAKPEVAMFAIYLLSERSERKIYMAYMATKGLPLYPEKIHFI